MNANAAAQMLATNARIGKQYDPDDLRFVKSISAENAQKLANDGFIVVAAWLNPSGGSGHLTTVRPDEADFNEKYGPLVSQIGGSVSVMSTRDAFGVGTSQPNTAESMDDIKYYYYPNQEFSYDPSQLGNSWGYPNE